MQRGHRRASQPRRGPPKGGSGPGGGAERIGRSERGDGWRRRPRARPWRGRRELLRVRMRARGRERGRPGAPCLLKGRRGALEGPGSSTSWGVYRRPRVRRGRPLGGLGVGATCCRGGSVAVWVLLPGGCAFLFLGSCDSAPAAGRAPAGGAARPRIEPIQAGVARARAQGARAQGPAAGRRRPSASRRRSCAPPRPHGWRARGCGRRGREAGQGASGAPTRPCAAPCRRCLPRRAPHAPPHARRGLTRGRGRSGRPSRSPRSPPWSPPSPRRPQARRAPPGRCRPGVGAGVRGRVPARG
jgi:hypothetical protein